MRLRMSQSTMAMPPLLGRNLLHHQGVIHHCPRKRHCPFQKHLMASSHGKNIFLRPDPLQRPQASSSSHLNLPLMSSLLEPSWRRKTQEVKWLALPQLSVYKAPGFVLDWMGLTP